MSSDCAKNGFTLVELMLNGIFLVELVLNGVTSL